MIWWCTHVFFLTAMYGALLDGARAEAFFMYVTLLVWPVLKGVYEKD